MRRAAITVGTIASLLVGALGASASAQVANPRPPKPDLGAPDAIARPLPPWVAGQVLVEFRRGFDLRRAAAWARARGAQVADRIPFFDVGVVRLPPGLSVLEAVERFGRSPAVRSVQPDLLARSFVEPRDARFDEQWALRNTGQQHPVTSTGRVTDPAVASGTAGADLEGPQAWEAETGRSETVIAVIDSGVDVEHPDIAPNLWANRGEVNGVAGEDDDGNGYVDDLHGWDFADDDDTLLESVVDGYEHGTHVAGIAAGEMDAPDTTAVSGDIAGVCPDCSIMVLKFMRRRVINGEPTLVAPMSAELEALAYARDNGADIVNASFGGFLWSGIERRAFQRLGRAGVLTVAAAGNENGDNDMFLTLNFDGNDTIDALSPLYPASYDLGSIVSVAASNHNDEYGYQTACAIRREGDPSWPCTFTNWGRVSVDVAAPGVDILSSVPGTAYDTFDGTSMAAPHVAGLAGLIASEHPGWGPARIKNAIVSSVDKPAALDALHAIPGVRATGGGFTATNGRVDARRALAADGLGAVATTDGTVRGARRLRRVARNRLSWPRDVNDVYEKKLVRGRRYRITLSGPPGEDFDIFVYKPGTEEIWQLELGCYDIEGACKLAVFGATQGAGKGGIHERFRFEARRSRRYYFQVSSFFSRGRYRLRIARL